MTIPAAVTAELAAFAASLTPDAMPDRTRHAAARLLLDTLGCMLAGAGSDVGRRSRAWASGNGVGGAATGSATVVGGEESAAPLFAAYVNGRAAAALDADETYPSDRQTSHLAASIVAAALAVTEPRGGSRGDLLTAIVAGYEIGARLCDSMVPSEGQAGRGLQAGWGPGTVLGAVAAAGRAAALDASTLAHGFGIAGMHIDSPPLQWADAVPAPMTKSADAGWHALTAIAGVEMASLGMTGYDRILDGDRGLWRALGYADWDPEAAVARLGERWIVEEASFKRWPCQFWMQPALTALWRVLEDGAIEAGEIDAVELETNDKCLGPRFLAAEPAGEIDRAFNFPHAVAMLAMRIPAGPAWSADEIADDPAVRRIRGCVRVGRHPDTDRIPARVVDHQIRDLPARATVRARGQSFTAETRFGLGSPWSPMTRLSDDALVAKFSEMTAAAAHGHAIVRWALDAPPNDPVRSLTAVLRAAPTRPASTEVT